MTADAGAGCPREAPMLGTPCEPVGLMCVYPPDPCTGLLRCNPTPAGTGVWSPTCAIGPLAPPELAAA